LEICLVESLAPVGKCCLLALVNKIVHNDIGTNKASFTLASFPWQVFWTRTLVKSHLSMKTCHIFQLVTLPRKTCQGELASVYSQQVSLDKGIRGMHQPLGLGFCFVNVLTPHTFPKGDSDLVAGLFLWDRK